MKLTSGFWQNLHIKLRLSSFGFEELVRLVPKTGSLLDIGCGFGLWLKLLRQKFSKRELYGMDPDVYKIEVAKRLLTNARIKLKRALPKNKRFVVVTILDVLYLLPEEEREKLLENVFGLLKSNGKLMIAFVPKENSWRYYLAWLQELIMVKALSGTHTSGAINFETQRWMQATLDRIGFKNIKYYVLPTPWPWWHKHVVVVCDKLPKYARKAL